MECDTSALASAIGLRVRNERQARGWTLDRLSELAGVSRRMLVNVEHGATNPSVGTLLKISDALGIGLPALVEPPGGPDLRVTRAGEGTALWTSSSGGRGVLVTGTEPPDVVELWDWTLGPGDRHATEAHATGTRELLQVLEGRIVVEVGGMSIDLSEGDGLAFAGDVAHAYADPYDEPARFSLAVFEPGVAPGPRPEVADA